jgi:hypothetical protein
MSINFGDPVVTTFFLHLGYVLFDMYYHLHVLSIPHDWSYSFLYVPACTFSCKYIMPSAFFQPGYSLISFSVIVNCRCIVYCINVFDLL